MKKIFSVISLVSLLGACSSDENLNLSMEERFNEAHDAMMAQKYGEAVVKFESFEKDYPASVWAPNALIDGAFSAYMDEDYVSAMTLTDRFMRFHPGYKDADYVLYLRGMIAYNQISDLHRDVSMTETALINFKDLVERYPNSKYTNNVKNKILILRNQIAGKVLNQARRQMKIRNYTLSITVLQGLVNKFSDTVVTPEALFRLAESFYAINMKDKADEALWLLHNNYPDSDWSKKEIN